MRRGVLSAALVLALSGAGLPSRALVIDAFTEPQFLTGAQPSGAPATSQVSGDMLGGQRTMAVGGVLPGLAATASVAGGALTFSQTAPGQRLVDLAWQVDDPIDLTEGGAATAFLLHVDGFSGTTVVFVNVSSDAFGLQLSQASRLLTGTGPLLLELAEFLPSEENANQADITSVLLITLRVQTTGDATLSGGIAIVPEPNLAALGAAGVLLFGASARANGRRRRSARG